MFFDEQSQFVKFLGAFEYYTRPIERVYPPRNFHSLSFRLQGTAEIKSAQSEGQAKAGELLYTPAGLPFQCKTKEDHLIILHFKMEGSTLQDFEIYTPAKPEIYQRHFTSLLEIWQSKYPSYTYRATSVFYKILEQMHREFTHGGSPAVYRRLKPAVTFIHEHFTEAELSVDQLCSLLSLSDTQFRKLFYEEFRTTPLRYINALRISRAEDLLEEGLSIEEVTRRCGFSDPKYFATVFKKHKGLPPSRYRK